MPSLDSTPATASSSTIAILRWWAGWADAGTTNPVTHEHVKLITCDVHRIEAADPYPESYDATVDRNVREQNDNARPAIANPLLDIDQYDTVLLASGVWNVRAPMIMTTFTESFNFTGKTIHPVTTHAMSGLGNAKRDYATSCPDGVIGQGLAVKGEEVTAAGPGIQSWLQDIGLLEKQHPDRPRSFPTNQSEGPDQ
ncbi:flavodoxin [Paenarthrobacter sp. RAF54_2]|uniref:flavodoxin n=1 Tax=Paenarthrobacter sp. RAF54_2 TaxID=3233061 RepID=UPI003F9723E0